MRKWFSLCVCFFCSFKVKRDTSFGGRIRDRLIPYYNSYAHNEKRSPQKQSNDLPHLNCVQKSIWLFAEAWLLRQDESTWTHMCIFSTLFKEKEKDE